jgi:tetratricopeptide (TPR) repeat protein
LSSFFSIRSRALLAGIAVLCACQLGRATPSQARASFDRGLSLYKRGNYDEAAAAFMRAYRMVPHVDSLYNAGLAFELAGEKATAATAYVIALDKELRPAAREDASQRLGRLSRELGRIEISVPDGAKISVPPFSLPGTDAVFYLEPGRHRVLITLEDGTPLSRGVDAVANDTTVVLVERPRPGSVDPELGDAGGSKQPGAVPASSSRDLRTLGWVSIGVSAAAAGAAVLLGLEAISAKDDYDASGYRNGDDRARAERLMLWTNIAWATAAVTGVAGGVLLYTSRDDAGTTSGFQLRGRF